MLNKCHFMGRLTAAPVMRYTGNNTPVCSFSIACERDFKNEDGSREVDFVDFVAWRGTAEFVHKYFEKGTMAVVSGRFQKRHYTDKDGRDRFAAEFVVENVYFGESKNTGSPGSPNDHEVLQPSAFEELEGDAEKDDLPF